MVLMIGICVFVVSAVICHLIAKRRGANPVYWGVIGFLCGPLAIPFVFLARSVIKGINNTKESNC